MFNQIILQILVYQDKVDKNYKEYFPIFFGGQKCFNLKYILKQLFYLRINKLIFNRPGVAGAVLQTPLTLIH